jgi:LCP family protein required for cell wall assembly
MKKKLTIEEIEKSVSSIPEEKNQISPKTAVTFARKKKRRKIKRIVILSIVALILVGLGWLGWISYQSMKNIFGGENAPGLLGLIDKKQLKGEASGRVNVLILGVGDENHAGSTLSDTMMVLSYDTKSKNIAMVSIPRDMYVKIDKDGYAKINEAHAYGEEHKVQGGGPELARQTVSNVLDLPIHYYVRFDFTGFKKLVDAVGGVDVNVEKDLYDPYYPGGNFSIKKGIRHMDGTLALKYARSRETTSDFDRAKRQQQVIVAVKNKILSSQTLFNPKKILDIIQIIGNHVKTDFKTNEFQRILELAKGVDSNRIINKVIDNGADGLLMNGYGITPSSAGSTLIPKAGLDNYSAIRNMVRNVFTGNQIKAEGAKISVLNGTGRSGLATQVADDLKSQGYNVVNYGTALTGSQNTTAIYDYTNGSKSNTIKALEKYFSAKAEKRNNSNNSYDIEIIIGRSYNG